MAITCVLQPTHYKLTLLHKNIWQPTCIFAPSNTMQKRLMATMRHFAPY